MGRDDEDLKLESVSKRFGSRQALNATRVENGSGQTLIAPDVLIFVGLYNKGRYACTLKQNIKWFSMLAITKTLLTVCLWPYLSGPFIFLTMDHKSAVTLLRTLAWRPIMVAAMVTQAVIGKNVISLGTVVTMWCGNLSGVLHHLNNDWALGVINVKSSSAWIGGMDLISTFPCKGLSPMRGGTPYGRVQTQVAEQPDGQGYEETKYLMKRKKQTINDLIDEALLDPRLKV
nr:hypothetical protein [Tanacetum cinerariifolium]